MLGWGGVTRAKGPKFWMVLLSWPFCTNSTQNWNEEFASERKEPRCVWLSIKTASFVPFSCFSIFWGEAYVYTSIGNLSSTIFASGGGSSGVCLLFLSKSRRGQRKAFLLLVSKASTPHTRHTRWFESNLYTKCLTQMVSWQFGQHHKAGFRTANISKSQIYIRISWPFVPR